MYEITFSKRAERSLKRLHRSGSFSREAFDSLLTLLAASDPLPPRYKDHQLKGKLAEYRECHLVFDLLVVYERDDTQKVVTIVATGTHDDLF